MKALLILSLISTQVVIAQEYTHFCNGSQRTMRIVWVHAKTQAREDVGNVKPGENFQLKFQEGDTIEACPVNENNPLDEYPIRS